eukprot:CCRYP_014892-RB/>CCRYP_014892-RB protein AED:0.27 eAED:0.27 QI:0/0/0/1/1/1/3/1008/66
MALGGVKRSKQVTNSYVEDDQSTGNINMNTAAWSAVVREDEPRGCKTLSHGYGPELKNAAICAYTL